MDAGEASIIVDRCRPPDGLGSAPSTIKAVLWCLRGLGAPGSLISVHAEVIEDRTCLSERAVRKAMATLREHGVLDQVQAQAPGRPAGYRMNYARLAEWLSDDDRARIRLPTPSNTGTRCRRTPAPNAGEHRHLMPVSDQHRHLVPPTPASGAATPASGAGVPIRTAGASCIPAKDQQQQQAAAAAAVSPDRWEDMGRRAGLSVALAAQCADALTRRAWTDQEAAQIALERLAERQAVETPRNPVGLFLTILTAPGGPEPSTAAIKRASQLDAKRLAHLRTMTSEQAAALRSQIVAAFPDAEIAEEREWLAPTAAGRKARAMLWDLWHALKPQGAHA